MAMSLAVSSGSTDSGVETGNESNDVDASVVSSGLHGYDSLENDGIHIAIPPPPPTSPESANEGHCGDHEESETEMTPISREHGSDGIDCGAGGNSNSGFHDEDMDRDMEPEEEKDGKKNGANFVFESHGMNGDDAQRFEESYMSCTHSGTSSGPFSSASMFTPPPAPPVTPTNLNTCKALMKFVFPELPKLTCQFVDPPAGFQTYVTLEPFKNNHSKGYNVVTSASVDFNQRGNDSTCKALIPYEEREITVIRSARHDRRKARAQYGPGISQYSERKLRTAASAKNIPVLSKILESGVDPNAADEMGRTALHIAACKGYSEVVRMLLQAGANPNKKDSVGNTPLHLAACTNHFDVVTCLLRAGTDVSTLDNHGRNPLQLAQAKLKLIANAKQPISEDALKIKMEVQQIIEMMLEYLQKKGQDVEAELLNAFANRLTLSQTPAEVDADVKNLLANLSSLTLTPNSSNASRARAFVRTPFATPSTSQGEAGPSSSRPCLQPAKLLATPGPSHFIPHCSTSKNNKLQIPFNSNQESHFQQGDEANSDQRMGDCKFFKS